MRGCARVREGVCDSVRGCVRVCVCESVSGCCESARGCVRECECVCERV